MLTDEQTEAEAEGHTDITRSLEQCEVWLLGDPDTITAKTHLLDAIDEAKFQHSQFNQRYP